MSIKCILLFGGTFDPVHSGHVDIARYFCERFPACTLRIVPAGNPWQKPPLFATAVQRTEMVGLAFEAGSLSFEIDFQEINRQGPSFTIDTLRAVRAEVGPDACLVLIIGSDQLLNLHTWREWTKLSDYAHLAVARRVGSPVSQLSVDGEVGSIFFPRLALARDIRSTASGSTYLSGETFIDISATQIRKTLQEAGAQDLPVPSRVLDYIQENNLYRI